MRRASLTQLVECRTVNPNVTGSSPVGGVFGPVSSVRLERPAHNRAVMRSNPIGPTVILFYHVFYGEHFVSQSTSFEKLSITEKSYGSSMKCPVCEMDCVKSSKRYSCHTSRQFFFPVQIAACGTLTNGLPYRLSNMNRHVRAENGSSMKYLPICTSSWLKKGILNRQTRLLRWDLRSCIPDLPWNARHFFLKNHLFCSLHGRQKRPPND